MNAKQAYNIVSVFLVKNAKDIDNADEAYNKFKDVLEPKLLNYKDELGQLIQMYYNIEDFVADGEPIQRVFDEIDANYQ
mgnify:CR=1 FL=1